MIYLRSQKWKVANPGFQLTFSHSKATISNYHTIQWCPCPHGLEPRMYVLIRWNIVWSKRWVLASTLTGQPAIIPVQHHQCAPLEVPTACAAGLITMSHRVLHPAEREPLSQKSRRIKAVLLVPWGAQSLTKFLLKQPHSPHRMRTWFHEHLG